MISYNVPSGVVDNSMVREVTLNADDMLATIRYRLTVRGGPVEETFTVPFTVADVGGIATINALRAFARAKIATYLGVPQ